jgi:hypothetical protein
MENYRILAERIRFELNNLEKVILRGERAMTAYDNTLENQDLFLDSIALSLHDFYTGLELIFSKIATVVDTNMPTGREWHRDLLIQMGLDLSVTRPPVLSQKILENLDEYRRFRHVLRNVYAFDLEVTRIKPLMERSPDIFIQLKQELSDFSDLLDKISELR